MEVSLNYTKNPFMSPTIKNPENSDNVIDNN